MKSGFAINNDTKMLAELINHKKTPSNAQQYSTHLIIKLSQFSQSVDIIFFWNFLNFTIEYKKIWQFKY